MSPVSCPRGAWTRRFFLASLPAGLFAAAGRGRVFPPSIERLTDPATEFQLSRLTDPAFTSHLPPWYARPISRRSSFMLFASDRGESTQAFRMELRSGQSRQLTEASALDPGSVTLLPSDDSFCYFDGPALMQAGFSSLRPREIYRIADGWKRGAGFAVADDGVYAALVETNGQIYRLRLLHMLRKTATTLVEEPEEIRDPLPRPKRASALYLRSGAPWLTHFDGSRNVKLRVAAGETAVAQWNPTGESILYLHIPEDRKQLNSLREHVPDTGEDKLVARTTQYVSFGRNLDASVFVGASGSKASPHVLILVRAVKRELTLCEHKASDPRSVAPVFSPNSRRIYFESDRHGKPAIYTMAVEKLVEATESDNM